MLFRQLLAPQYCSYTYIIANDIGAEAIIIDPVRDHVEQYLRLINELQLKLVYSLETHIHADHITGAAKMRAATGCKLGIGAHAKVDCADFKYSENDLIKIPGIELRALHTPGHTAESYCLVAKDRVFTGDTLMIRGSGRTDFQAGSAKEQYASITEKLFALPEEMLVFPGHDYNGMTVSSISEEKHFNPRLHGKSCAEYIAIMDNLNLKLPRMIDVAVPANQNCGGE